MAMMQPPLDAVPRLHREPPPADHAPPVYDGTEKPIENDGHWRTLRRWFATFEPRLQVVHGPTGCGKTFAVEAIAFQQECKITELNGQDMRTAGVIDEFLRAMCGGATLQRRILLLDDADSMDETAFQKLVKAAKDGALPPTLVILNDYWCQNARPLHQLFPKGGKPSPIKFEAVGSGSLGKHARRLHPGVSNAAKLSKDVDGDLRQFQLRAEMGDACAGAMRIPNKFELTERLFDQLDPLSTPAAADKFALLPDLMTSMVHENLPRNARSIEGLADAMDALSHADEMRRGGAHAEAAILDAMAPFTGGAHKPKPEVKFTTLLGHIKESGVARKRIASDRQEALRREKESAEPDPDVRIRAAVDAAQRRVGLDWFKALEAPTGGEKRKRGKMK